jgi:hypothetical protein
MQATAQRDGSGKRAMISGKSAKSSSPISTATTPRAARRCSSDWEFQRREPVDIYGSEVEELVKGTIAGEPYHLAEASRSFGETAHAEVILGDVEMGC